MIHKMMMMKNHSARSCTQSNSISSNNGSVEQQQQRRGIFSRVWTRKQNKNTNNTKEEQRDETKQSVDAADQQSLSQHSASEQSSTSLKNISNHSTNSSSKKKQQQQTRYSNPLSLLKKMTTKSKPSQSAVTTTTISNNNNERETTAAEATVPNATPTTEPPVSSIVCCVSPLSSICEDIVESSLGGGGTNSLAAEAAVTTGTNSSSSNDNNNSGIQTAPPRLQQHPIPSSFTVPADTSHLLSYSVLTTVSETNTTTALPPRPKSTLQRAITTTAAAATAQAAKHRPSPVMRYATAGTANSQHRRLNASFAFSVSTLNDIIWTTTQQPAAAEPGTPEKTSLSSVPAGPLSAGLSLDSWATFPMSSIQCSVLTRDVSAYPDWDDEEEEENDNKEEEPSKGIRFQQQQQEQEQQQVPFVLVDESFHRVDSERTPKRDNLQDDEDDLVISSDDDSDDEDDSDVNKEPNNKMQQKNQLRQSERSSPTSVQSPPLPDWMLSWAQTSATPSQDLESSSSPFLLQGDVFPTTTKQSSSELLETPMKYLPLSAPTESCLGWMAVSTNDHLVALLSSGSDDDENISSCSGVPETQQHTSETTPILQHCDIACVYFDESPSGEPILTVKKESSSQQRTEMVINLSDCYVSTTVLRHEWGRAVIVRHKDTHDSLCTLLPVSLPPAFFETKQRDLQTVCLCDEALFAKLAPAMVTPFTYTNNQTSRTTTGKQETENSSNQEHEPFSSFYTTYAPAEQQDAVLHLLFRLDAHKGL